MENIIGELLSNFSTLDSVANQYVTLSWIFSIATLMISRPYFTIRFMTCVAHCMWKTFPFNKSKPLKDNFFKRISIVPSLLEQLSTIIINMFLSIFQINNTSERTSFVCGGT